MQREGRRRITQPGSVVVTWLEGIAGHLHRVEREPHSIDATAALAQALRDSGRVIAFPDDPRPIVDRHSTGGIGDKAGMILPALLATLGYRAPSVTAPGYGALGGTLDKLAGLPGVSLTLSEEHLIEQVQSSGCAICAPGGWLAPAEAELFAFRARTGLMKSPQLIVASILSKKAAARVQVVTVDVRYGSGMLIADAAHAESFAEHLTAVACRLGIDAHTHRTELTAPIGRSVGNWLEVTEVFRVLETGEPEDLKRLLVRAAAVILAATRRANSFPEGEALARTQLDIGAVLERWKTMLGAQGANLDAIESLRRAGCADISTAEVRADRTARVMQIAASTVGQVAASLRDGATADVGYFVGVSDLSQPGEVVERGAVLGRVHASTAHRASAACDELRTAFELQDV
jgi:thymidine phosphorylase